MAVAQYPTGGKVHFDIIGHGRSLTAAARRSLGAISRAANWSLVETQATAPTSFSAHAKADDDEDF